MLVVSRATFESGYAYSRVEVTTGRTQLLLNIRGAGVGSARPDLSPDGRFICFIDRDPQSSATRIMRRNLETGEEKALKKGSFGAVALSLDGKQLAYVGSEAAEDPRVYEVGVMPADGGPVRALFRPTSWIDGSRFATLGWNGDQRFVFFAKSSRSAAGAPEVLWRVPIAGGPPAPAGLELNARIKAPHVHPDGTKLVLSIQEERSGAVWVLENFLPSTASTVSTPRAAAIGATGGDVPSSGSPSSRRGPTNVPCGMTSHTRDCRATVKRGLHVTCRSDRTYVARGVVHA